MSHRHFKFFVKNRHGRDFVVGDIHGSFSAFEELLHEIAFDTQRDRVFSVGDLIDRGPESGRVLEFLSYPWFHAIMGNHERMLLDAAHEPRLRATWTQQNGGEWWEKLASDQQDYIYYQLARLPLAMEVATTNGNVGIVHADVPSTLTWRDFIQALHSHADTIEHALWSRTRYRQIRTMGCTTPVEGIQHLVVGHTPLPYPLHVENIHYIDTGASLQNEALLGKLTVLQIHPQLEIHQLDTRNIQLA